MERIGRQTCRSDRGSRTRLIAIWKRLKAAAYAAAIATAFLAPLALLADSFEFKGQTVEFENAEHVEGADAQTGQPVHFLIFRQDGWFKPSQTAHGRALLVGGGGAGGYGTTAATNPGGGGGGGEVVDQKDLSYLKATTHNVTIGAGGAQTTAAGNGENGHPSKVLAGETVLASALGGGGGGAKGDGNGTNIVGMVVATGGGGGGLITSGVFGKGGLGTRFNGGNAVIANRAGGGAGAGGDGNPSTLTKGGDGGEGATVALEIWFPETLSIPTVFGGGGGGGQSYDTSSSKAGSGGTGGGGNGGRQNNAPGDGTANTGGGGGGGGRCTTTHSSKAFYGGAGGSGIVIIRFEDIEVPINWISIPVSAGGSDGKIFVDENASWRWLDNKPNTELIITYTNTTVDGGLAFFNPTNAAETLPPVWAKARVLVVGGGGGGGFVNTQKRGGGGGGGAGGFVEKEGLVFDNSVEFSISVGAGGAGGKSLDEKGGNGGDSYIKTNSFEVVDTAKGGGGGGTRLVPGQDGASGGGSAWQLDDVGGGQPAGGKGIDGQGFAGGKGQAAYVGGGGGGAGGKGGDTADNVPGVGGDGRESDICGTNVWYAGGGGGAYVNAATDKKWYLGGAGGKGGGGHGAGAKDGGTSTTTDVDPDPAASGVDGLGGGGGGGSSHDGATSPAGNGGSGIVIIRLSGFVVRNIQVPKSKDFTYDGTMKRGVDEFFAYDLSGEPTGTDSKVYSVTLTLNGKTPDTVEWGDEQGGRGPRTVYWEIHQMKVEVPVALTGFVYSEKTKGVPDKKTAVKAGNKQNPNGGVDPDGNCWTNTAAAVPVRFCSLTGHVEENAGNYKFTASLWTDGGTTTNFVWTKPATMADREVSWSIAQATNTITKLTLDDWQYEVEKTDQPSATSTFKNATDPYVYTYHRGEYEPEDPSGYELHEKPTEPGVYWVRVYLSKDTEHSEPHQFGNWGACEKSKRFCVWQHPTKVLQDYVDIMTAGYSGSATLTDFPVLVRLREPLCNATGAVTNGLPGFTYAHAGHDGSELRFVSLPADGDYKKDETERDLTKDALLPFEVEEWNTHGESRIWVKVPTVVSKTTKFRMYWHRRPEAKVTPDRLPQDTWSDYAGVWHLNETTGTFKDSSGNGLDLTAAVEPAKNPVLGGAVYAPNKIHLVCEDYMKRTGVISTFYFSGWYRGDTYTTAGMAQRGFVGTKMDQSSWQAAGWAFFMNNNVKNTGASAGNTYSGDCALEMTTAWQFLAYSCPASGGSHSAFFNGANQKNFNGTVVDSGLPLQVVGNNFSGDEIRMRKTVPANVATWTKAEYDTVKIAAFCTFGLANQLQPDGTRAWVNWWSTVPWATAASKLDPTGRYWEPGELTASIVNLNRGVLARVYGKATYEGTPGATSFKMPGKEPASADDLLKKGAYQLVFDMINADAGTTDFPRKHIIFEGARAVNVEVVGDAPQPIDPTVAGTGLRVLLGNDDSNEKGPVSNQEYAVWHHLNDGYSDSFTNNLLPGTEHELTNAAGRVLWKLTDVYMGNLMTTNAAGQPVVPPRTLTLPWSATASTNCNFVMRNVGGTDDDPTTGGATIVSPWYTNGIGTVYFDAVNGYETNAAAFRLVVEISTNETAAAADAEWTRLDKVVSCKYNGTNLGKPETNDVVDLNMSGGDGKTLFCRVIAPVNRRDPLRFRIRRVAEFFDGEGYPADDPRGFLVIDNVICSWPTASGRLTSPGWYDSTKDGKQTLGVEKVFSVDFPTAADSNNLNVAAVYTGDIELKDIVSARCYYRWRYLDGAFRPAQVTQGGEPKPVWDVIFLDKDNGFRTSEPLQLPGREGDIEYWFDLTAVIPYYAYVDYSGRSIAKPTGDYTEDPAKGVTSRFRDEPDYPFGPLPSLGEEWFVRLRHGESELETMALVVKGRGEFPMELVEDHVWRGYFKTSEAIKGGIDFRIEARNWQDPSTADFLLNTNLWVAESAAKLPMSAILKPDGTTNDWANVPVDAATGYLMFQVDDRTRSLSVTHCDFQDFNLWDDAKSDTLFSGSSSADGEKSGVSPDKRETDETFTYRGAAWAATPDVKRGWEESFDTSSALEYKDYEPFGAASTPEGWKSGPGMFVNQWYKYSTAIGGLPRRALQLKGSGEGYVQFPPTPDNVPRGIGTFSFQARLGQFVDLDRDISFAQFPNVDTAVTKNYTFVSLAAFDTEKNQAFSGNASLSLFAYYSVRGGAYELRYEQIGANVSGTTVTGPSNSRRISLYKWQADATGKMTTTLLGYKDIGNYQVKTDGLTGRYTPFYISCQNESKAAGDPNDATVIKIGIYRNDTSASKDNEGFPYNAAITTLGDRYFYNYVYRDTKNPLKRGTYGVLTANCDGLFLRPHVGHAPVPTTKTDKDKLVDDGTNNQPALPELFPCEDDIRDLDAEEIWNFNRGRMATFWADHYLWGIEANPLKQGLVLQISPRGKTPSEWTTVDTYEIENFGSAGASGKTFTTRLDRPQDYDVQLKVTSAIDDARTDIIVDNLRLSQWRGCDYGDDDTTSFLVGKQGQSGWATNFTFSSAWVENEIVRTGQTNATVLLSAKRTSGWAQGAKACGLRGPLYDGAGDPPRGIGLGSFSFTYRNAQENAKLLVQIATNGITSTSADSHNIIDDAFWTTVTNVDFSVMTRRERESGRVDVSLGLHGVKGMMRVIVDPAVVEQVSPTTWLDGNLYGEVEITRVYCRDEPPLDFRAWWGWNLQTTDAPARRYLQDGLIGGVSGLSFGLNDSAKFDVKPSLYDYDANMPFVQTPSFRSNIVGQVSFRARKYDGDEFSQPAEVILYGANIAADGASLDWHCASNDVPLARFVVSNVYYTSYSYKTRPGENYNAFRLGVGGVPDVKWQVRGQAPTEGALPVRVMLDEVCVSEAIRPQVGFRYCTPVRDGLTDNLAATNVGQRESQPIMGDAWTVQAEIQVKLLPDEIDLTTPGHEPRVFFHWYCGTSPWGYQQWKSKAGAQTAELKLAEGETMLFRGSYLTSPDAVVMAEPSTATYTYRIYQYAADVVYWDTKGNCITGSLERGEWERPEWYAPLDLNRTNGGNADNRFAGYNVLESVAPGRAWINEVNLFDGKDPRTFEYPAQTNQYVEIAVPRNQSLRNWRLNVIDYNSNTNWLCIFGQNGVAEEKIANAASNYVFVTVQSPLTKDAKSLDASDGEVDGTWESFKSGNYDKGELDQTHAVGLQLVRPSGIIAQEMVFMGTNAWGGTAYEEKYSVERRAEELNEADAEQQWLPAGNEYGGTLKTSLGVTNLAVEAVRSSAIVPQEVWTSRRDKTPGRINVGQVIPADWAIYPSGDMLIVNATVTGAYLSQTVGGVTNTTATVTVVTKKEGDGTNITYRLDSPWYEIGEIRENGVVTYAGGGRGTFTYAAAKGSKESVVTVTATSRPWSELRDKYGLTERNPYSDAVLDWLTKGKRLDGTKFEYPGAIDLPEVLNLSDAVVTNLSLTETYWFDIDPTGSNWCWKAGTVVPPHEYTHVTAYGETKTNVQLGVYMVITNRSTEGVQAGKNWSPYVLRGKIPGTHSQQYAHGETNKWDSVNFKMSGDIQNDRPLRVRWVPLRYFIFDENSFDENHRSIIDIPYPYSRDSLSVNYGWMDFIGSPIFYSWWIDDRNAPVAIETLRPSNIITW